MKRAKKDPSAWVYTADGHAKYLAARAEAQSKADALRLDVGIERNDLFKSFHVFLLPAVKYRSGHELRCEVVRPTSAPEQVFGPEERCKHCGKPFPGHGVTCQ